MNSVLLVLAVLAGAFVSAQHHHHLEDNGPAHYKFEYGVHDPHTGDLKSQYEHRDGHTVKGAYTIKDADGTTRVVEYTADPHSGFNAVVKRIGHAQHPLHYKTENDHHGNYHHQQQGHYGGNGGDSFNGVTHWGH